VPAILHASYVAGIYRVVVGGLLFLEFIKKLALQDSQHAASINPQLEHLYFLNGVTPSVGCYIFPLAQ
jgi:hypothetical protein